VVGGHLRVELGDGAACTAVRPIQVVPAPSGRGDSFALFEGGFLTCLEDLVLCHIDQMCSTQRRFFLHCFSSSLDSLAARKGNNVTCTKQTASFF